MKGKASSIAISGTTVKLGDYLKVRYTTGEQTKDATIEGTVVELWDPALGSNVLQARLSCGWCFHDWDEIIEHKPRGEVSNEQ